MTCTIIIFAAVSISGALCYVTAGILASRPILDGRADDVEVIISAAGDRAALHMTLLRSRVRRTGGSGMKRSAVARARRCLATVTTLQARSYRPTTGNWEVEGTGYTLPSWLGNTSRGKTSFPARQCYLEVRARSQHVRI